MNQKIRKPPLELKTEEQILAQSFYARSCEYCMLTRLAFKNSLISTIGYVAHQSFEHMLKGGLADNGYGINKMRDFQHNLPSLLDEYMSISQRNNLKEFAGLLKRFDEKYILRYPIPKMGSHLITAAIRKKEIFKVAVSLGGKKIESFSYNLEEFDELFCGLANIINKDQIGYLINISTWKDMYRWENYHLIDDTAV